MNLGALLELTNPATKYSVDYASEPCILSAPNKYTYNVFRHGDTLNILGLIVHHEVEPSGHADILSIELHVGAECILTVPYSILKVFSDSIRTVGTTTYINCSFHKFITCLPLVSLQYSAISFHIHVGSTKNIKDIRVPLATRLYETKMRRTIAFAASTNVQTFRTYTMDASSVLVDMPNASKGFILEWGDDVPAVEEIRMTLMRDGKNHIRFCYEKDMLEGWLAQRIAPNMLYIPFNIGAGKLYSCEDDTFKGISRMNGPAIFDIHTTEYPMRIHVVEVNTYTAKSSELRINNI